MDTILPMSLPISETYQLTAFILGIVSQKEEVKKCIYNSCINLYVSQNDWGETTIDLSSALCEDYRVMGVGEMDLYYLRNISKAKCASFLKERIEQGNYLLFFNIDEYYLSYSHYYKKRHFIHDTYLYGYDELNFYVMAYSKEHLRMLKVPQQEITEGLYSSLKRKGDTHFCTFRIYHNARIEIDAEAILKQVDMYLEGGTDTNGNRYGIQVYSVLQDIIDEAQRDSGIEGKIDIRVFRMFWEHKKILVARNNYLKNGIIELGDLADIAKELEQNGSMIMMMLLKYNITNNKELLKTIEMQLCFMRELEVKYWENFREVIRRVLRFV